jgi:hypothetical protein
MKSVVLFLLASAALFGQVDNNAHGWYMYFGDHPIGKSRFGAHLEGQWRRADLGLAWQQLLLRPALNFQLNKKVMLTGGYGFIQTHRYGDFPARENFPEHRTYEQAQITQRFAGLPSAKPAVNAPGSASTANAIRPWPEPKPPLKKKPSMPLATKPKSSKSSSPAKHPSTPKPK